LKSRHETIDSVRKEIGSSIAHIKLKKLSKSAEIFTVPDEIEEEWYEVFEEMFGKEHRKYNQGLIFNLDKTMMYEFGITTEMVAKKIQDNFMDAAVVWSPNNLARVDVWIDVADADYDEEIFSSPDEAINTYLEEVCKPALADLAICGIEGISAVFYDKKDGEWMIETDGSNLRKLFAHPSINAVRTISNDMWEIYENLGIEAARNFLIEEFSGVISSDGTFVNDSHALLLVDVMTFSGTITSVSRYGLKKEACGPMAKASFEESLDNFLKAGQNGDKETTNGVSASIMLGKMGKFGTGLCDIVIDIKQLAGLPRTINQQVRERR
jgi:DNA-directed RNA polymerase II subunit RPB1